MTLAIIGGSGFQNLPELNLELGAESDSFSETRCGWPSAPVYRGEYRGRKILFLSRHGEQHSIAPHLVNYRANLLALQAAGTTRIIAINAVGGIGPGFDVATLVICDQLIDYTWGRAHTYSDNLAQPLQHVDFTEPYDPEIRQLLLTAAAQSGIPVVDGGVLGVVQGPRLETAAEILRMQRDGCDLVGMTGMPEAALARELGIPYACIAIVVNAAAGTGNGPIALDDITAILQSSRPSVMELIKQVCLLT